MNKKELERRLEGADKNLKSKLAEMQDEREAIATIREVRKTDRIYNENRCVCCGAVIPEGRQICIPCECLGGKMI